MRMNPDQVLFPRLVAAMRAAVAFNPSVAQRDQLSAAIDGGHFSFAGRVFEGEPGVECYADHRFIAWLPLSVLDPEDVLGLGDVAADG